MNVIDVHKGGNMSYQIGKRCVKCGICELTCPKEAISIRNRNYYIERSICDGCDKYEKPICKKVCPIKKAIVEKTET
ncbi:4Fe-4S binding protein [Candidatus Riesia pediculischaeffi]|uniref:4Fe-4S ferredoxin-type domain-containing protein n=2 Tax=Candidatus Riesia pediculischaeffi TaxID=428411 RepID=A0A1V0HKD3_9ENTR|nr:4Fe-4S dicluster domain-containing protein [Candidatus Riesia pediculischaeffi]ARC53297.1 hypothetical protein AOQ87_01210 [Candidatus Riesia pediculischaeffi]KIE63742.1 hypothetical protein P689_122224 [Candidatus Riesia pediculischaeffi PTSU]